MVLFLRALLDLFADCIPLKLGPVGDLLPLVMVAAPLRLTHRIGSANARFSKTLRAIRETRMVSQDDFAHMIGVSRQTYWRWEHEKCTPNLRDHRKLADVLNEVELDLIQKALNRRRK